MARIQKKKPVLRRKGKQEEASAAQVPSSQSAPVDAKAPALEAVKETPDSEEKKRKQPQAVVQAPVAEQSAIQKLVDKYFGTWVQFFREVRVELGKVTWPSRKQTIGSTAVVIIFVFMIALFLGVVDFGLSNIVQLIF
jgi:preprotein translocase subunit SecE